MADGKVKIETSVDQKGIQVGLQETEKKVASFGKSTQENFTGIDAAVSKAGQTIATFVSAAAIASAVKQATDYVIQVGSAFEASMSEVQAISGATGAELEKMSAKAKQLGSTTKFSATEASQAFKYMALAGWDTNKSISAIDGVLQLAAASGMDLAAASDMVTDYLSAFGMEASQATYMADMLAYAQSHSNTTAEQLGEAYKNCAANMNASGQDIETTTALLEALANQGAKGSEAGTKVAAIMRDVTAKMDEGKIAIGDTTVAVMDANGNFRDMTDIIKDVDTATQGMGDAEKAAALASTFTSDSISGLNMILNEGVDKIAGYEEELRNSSGAAADMADTMQNNLQGKITAAGSALEGLGIAAYDYVSGPAGKVVDVATGIFKGLTDVLSPELDTAHQLLADAESTSAAVQSIYQKMEDQKKSFTSSRDSIEANAVLAKRLADNLYDLADKADLSATDLATMGLYVDELNSLIPDMNLSLNDQTGELSMTRVEVDKLTQSYKEQAIQQAFMEHYSELAADYAEAIKTAAEAKKNFDMALSDPEASAVYEDYKSRAEEFINAGEDTEDAYIHAGNAIAATSRENGELLDGLLSSEEAMNDAEQAVTDCDSAMQEWDETIQDYKESMSSATDETTNFSQAQEDVTNSTQDLLTATIEYKGETYKTTQEISEQFQKLEENYDSVYESAQSSIIGQLSLYNEWSAGAEITASQALENFASYVSGMTSYSENLSALTKGVEDVSNGSIEVLDAGFVQYLRDLGPQSASLVAAIAQEINAGNVQYIEDLNANWRQYYNVSTIIADENAEAETGYKEFAEDLVSTAQQTAQNTTQATADGISSVQDRIHESTSIVMKDFTDTLTIPDETSKIGSDNIAGYITGAESKQQEVSNTAIALATTTEDGLTDTAQTTQIGSDNVAGYIVGAESQKEAAQDTAVGISEATDEGLGSADTAATAGNLLASLLGVLVAGTTLAWVDGVAVSTAMNLGLGSANTAGTANDLASKYTNELNNHRGNAESSGRYLVEGFAAGIDAGKSRVVSAAADSARAALAAFRAVAQIHSPSAAAKADALFVPEGWAGGIEEGQEKVEKAAADTADITLDSFRDIILPGIDTSLVIEQLTQQPQILAESVTESSMETAVRFTPDGQDVTLPEIDYEKVGTAVASAIEGMDVRMDGKRVGKVLTGHINNEMHQYAQMNERGVM
ncbi:MAG: phage tail tape measure protein [Lachnospiraceae bacterium]|nr:phage tail tape measure protein [Lachnospiraceae bacterium]